MPKFFLVAHLTYENQWGLAYQNSDFCFFGTPYCGWQMRTRDGKGILEVISVTRGQGRGWNVWLCDESTIKARHRMHLTNPMRKLFLSPRVNKDQSEQMPGLGASYSSISGHHWEPRHQLLWFFQDITEWVFLQFIQFVFITELRTWNRLK